MFEISGIKFRIKLHTIKGSLFLKDWESLGVPDSQNGLPEKQRDFLKMVYVVDKII